MFGRLDGYALIFLTVILTIFGIVSTQWDDYKQSGPPPPRYSFGGSRTGNYGSFEQRGLSNPDQEDEVGLALGKLAAISSSISEALMPRMGPQTSILKGFTQTPKYRSNSQTPPNGGYSRSYNPASRYDPYMDEYRMRNRRPPSRPIETSPIREGTKTGWYKIGPDLSFIPAPEGQGYYLPSYTAPGEESPIQPPTRSSYTSGYSLSYKPDVRYGPSRDEYGKRNNMRPPIQPSTRPGPKEGTAWFTIGPQGQLVPAPEGEGFKGTVSYFPAPGSSINSGSRDRDWWDGLGPTRPSASNEPQWRKPLTVLPPRPYTYSKPTAPESPNPLHSLLFGSTGSTSWFEIGPDKQLVPENQGFQGTVSYFPAAGSSGNPGSRDRDWQGMLGGLGPTKPSVSDGEGSPIQPSTRPSLEGGYIQSPNPYGDKNGNDKTGYGKPVSSGSPMRLGKYSDGDEATNALLGLFAGIDDGPDHIGPPQFKPLPSLEKPSNAINYDGPQRPKPLPSLEKPSNPSAYDGPQRPKPLPSLEKPSKPSAYDGPQQPKPLPVSPQRPSTYSKPNAPESANAGPTEGTGWFEIGPGGQFVPAPAGQGYQGSFSQFPAPGSSGNPGSGNRNRQGMSGGLGPITKGGKQVGTSKGRRKQIIDGQEYMVEEWVLTPREQLEMDAEPQGNLQMLGKFSTDLSPASQLDTYQGATKNIDLYSFYESAYKDKWNDPMWNLQWYMHDYRTKDVPVMDMNVVPAWDLGYTGKNVKIVVVDDGVMHGHPDLAPNHLEDMSYDFDLNKKGSQPSEPLSENSHGTKCASQIAMVAGNGLCGVGMAYDAKIAGVRSGVGKKTTAYQASLPLTHMMKEMDISSNSYGPDDDGKVMQRAPQTVYDALLKGVTEGRGGKGLVYVFPSGNGRQKEDHCGADAYMNVRFTIGITSATQHGKVAEYSERCAAVMAAAYSSGGSRDETVVTVEMANNCNDTFGGTSAAVPHGTAVIALMLQANPNLTYRDVMHIITMGTEVAPLANNKNTWRRNGAGFWVSHDFGFGLLNAKNLVLLAKKWTNVPVEHNTCVVNFPIWEQVNFETGRTAIVKVYADGCPAQKSVTWIENIEIEITVKYGYRGALSVTLTSPSGTVSDLLESRMNDNGIGIRDWIFRSVQHWGENPTGTWELRVTGNALEGLPALSGSIDKAILSFHGMAGNPPHQKNLPRTYSAFRLPDNRSSQERMPA